MIGNWLFEYIGSWFGYSPSGPSPDPDYAPNTRAQFTVDYYCWNEQKEMTMSSTEDIFTWIEAGDDV